MNRKRNINRISEFSELTEYVNPVNYVKNKFYKKTSYLCTQNIDDRFNCYEIFSIKNKHNKHSRDADFVPVRELCCC